MKHVQQPKGSNQCGQACIAMLSGCPLEVAIELVGKKGKTRTKDLASVINRRSVGFLVGLSCPDRLIPLREKYGDLPRYCIVKACSQNRKRSHWMLIFNYLLHDPECPTAPHPDVCKWDITSYLPLSGGICNNQ
jgi:hypothetical protein